MDNRMRAMGMQGQHMNPHAAMGYQPASADTLERLLADARRRIKELEAERDTLIEKLAEVG